MAEAVPSEPSPQERRPTEAGPAGAGDSSGASVQQPLLGSIAISNSRSSDSGSGSGGSRGSVRASDDSASIAVAEHCGILYNASSGGCSGGGKVRRPREWWWRWCCIWPCFIATLIVGVMLTLWVYWILLLTYTTGSLTLIEINNLCDTEWLTTASAPVGGTTIQICNPSPVFTVAITNVLACVCTDPNTLALYNSSFVVPTAGSTSQALIAHNCHAASGNSTASVPIICVDITDPGTGAAQTVTLPIGGCSNTSVAGVAFHVQEDVLLQYLNVALMIHEFANRTFLHVTADVTAHIGFEYSIAVDVFKSAAELQADAKTNGNGGGGGGGGGDPGPGLAIGTVSLNDSSAQLSIASVLLFNLSSSLAIHLPALDLSFYVNDKPFLDFSTPATTPASPYGQRIAQNTTAGPVPLTPSGLPLSPCIECAAFESTVTITNDTESGYRQPNNFLRLLELAYANNVTVRDFDVQLGRNNRTQAATCLLNRLVAGINFQNFVDGPNSGSVSPPVPLAHTVGSYVIRDITWAGSTDNQVTAEVGVEIGPRVFFVAGALPAFTVLTSLVPPHNASAPLPPLALGSLSFPSVSLQLRMNRFHLLLVLATPDSSILSNAVFAPFLCGRIDNVPAGYISSTDQTLRYQLTVGTAAEVSTSDSMLLWLAHEFSTAPVAAPLFRLSVNTTELTSNDTSHYLNLNELSFLFDLLQVKSEKSDTTSLYMERTLLLPAATLYDTGTPVLTIPPIKVALLSVPVSADGRPVSPVTIANFEFDYEPLEPLSTLLTLKLTWGVPGAGYLTPLFTTELNRVLSAIAWRVNDPVIDYLYLDIRVDFFRILSPYTLRFPTDDDTPPFAVLATVPLTVPFAIPASPAAACTPPPPVTTPIATQLTVNYNNWWPVDITVLPANVPFLFQPVTVGSTVVIDTAAATALANRGSAFEFVSAAPRLFGHDSQRTYTDTFSLLLSNSSSLAAQPIDACGLYEQLTSAGATVQSSAATSVQLPVLTRFMTFGLQAADFRVNLTLPALQQSD